MKKFTYLFIALFSLSLITTSCREEKSTGDKIEEAVDETGKALKDAVDEVEEDLEDASDEVKDAAEDLQDEIEEVTTENNNDS